jgi:hypothetical protein
LIKEFCTLLEVVVDRCEQISQMILVQPLHDAVTAATAYFLDKIITLLRTSSTYKGGAELQDSTAIDPLDGTRASVNDAAQWSTFQNVRSIQSASHTIEKHIDSFYAILTERVAYFRNSKEQRSAWFDLIHSRANRSSPLDGLSPRISSQTKVRLLYLHLYAEFVLLRTFFQPVEDVLEQFEKGASVLFSDVGVDQPTSAFQGLKMESFSPTTSTQCNWFYFYFQQLISLF